MNSGRIAANYMQRTSKRNNKNGKRKSNGGVSPNAFSGIQKEFGRAGGRSFYAH